MATPKATWHGLIIATEFILVLCLWNAGAQTVHPCYEAIGYLSYTTFSKSGLASGKNVLLFDVKVNDKTWQIHTEPVVQTTRGIAFFEASSSSNDSLLMITAFVGAPGVEPKLQALRTELQRSDGEDVYFDNPQPPSLSNLLHRAVSSRKATTTARTTNTLNNVAVARALQGKFPSVDPSFIALLWFAFTPPAFDTDSKEPLLLQIWDDGNPLKHRFRYAQWKEFPAPPHLMHTAVYSWMGKELAQDGQLHEISLSDVTDPSSTAARYDVDTTTNLEGLILPQKARLTRFSTKHGQDESPRVVSTVDVIVVSVSSLSTEESLQSTVPGQTFVSDYRLANKELRGGALRYVLDSNSPPTLQVLRRQSDYKHALAMLRASNPWPRRIVLALFVTVVALPAVFLLISRNKPHL